ncbi:glycosyltransferase [Pseudomonas fluorescens]|uniref:glycosyltransferase n=1 Tax=Pseudomonas fluorescens TaxID=294 RepID=UPI001241CA21|nr:glycosyltransferase [Pseudomonas fluorescens]VVN35094.1 Undecaprenyl-phosphate 4-deoxy-4-formamido-L-arabinose transferase [Pseudomonas fluorescens]
MNSPDKIRNLARSVYHWLPVSQRVKWLLRERLSPLLAALQNYRSLTDVGRGFVSIVSQDSSLPLRDDRCELALAGILETMAAHARIHGPVRHWIALPFLSAGGSEMVALNLCRALRELRPEQSVLLLITDRKLVNERIEMPEGVLRLAFDDYLVDNGSYARKQVLLRDLLVAAKPDVFHNINSEVAWHLILQEGERLQHYTRLFASIFAFQFAPNGHTKIGYAAYFLKKGMPHLLGLLSDNQRFVNDAALEYQLTPQDKSRMAVLYQPCRLLTSDNRNAGHERLTRRQVAQAADQQHTSERPQVLWAGRLDAEKRIDLFLEVVRRCTFADFRVFGQVVLGDGEALPALPNLSYEGPFSSPLEWLERFEFDAFVFTSNWEGMPNILIEVGALGIPVIAPTVGGVGELITENTGYPLPERPTVDDYEQALRYVVNEPAQALQRAKQLHDLVVQRHSWDHFVASIAAVPDYLGSVTRREVIKEADSRTVAASPAGASEPPLVSVIIPCYNQGQYLQESVVSALMACRHPMEIIVVDDGSTDGRTARYLSEAEQLAPGIVRIHRQVNSGLSGARNSGIALARGQYVQFLDTDDVLAPGKIDAQVAQLQVNPDLMVSVCNFLLCDEVRAQFLKPEEAIARFDLTEQDFLYRWERGFAIPIHCGLFSRSLLDGVQFDTHARAKEDWLFWTSLAMAGTRFGYIHGHWAIYRQHAASMRRSYVNMGRSWLQAGLKIETMLAGREPLFFESVVSWFEQCYRSNPSYRTEIAQLQATPGVAVASTAVQPASDTAADVTSQVQSVADAILEALARLPDAGQPPLISVVVPVYGHFEFLQGCLESLAVQGDVSIEVVCIDDGSPDPRVTSLMKALHGKNSRLTARVEATNRGISAVQNAAVNIARGEYVAFLDCDDALETGALQAVRTALEKHPEVDYLFTDRIDVDETGKTVRVARYGGYDNLHFTQQDNIAADLIDGMVASHLKVIRRSVYQAVGGCDAIFSGVQDWELALRIAQAHELYYLSAPLYRHRVHSGSVTRSDNVSQLRKTNQVRQIYLERSRDLHTNARPARVFQAHDLPVSLDVLKTAWKQGEHCVADVSGTVNLGQINFLREYNSYFDQILWSDPKVPAALYGYLWDGLVFRNKQAT